MSYPPLPLTIQCIDRVVEVLKNVVAGDDYFYTIGEKVAKGLRSFEEATGYPFDCVYLGADHKEPEFLPDHRVYRYPTIIITGFVDEEAGEPITKLAKHLADVQEAIETDLRSGTAGSLGTLVGWGRIGSVITDEGEMGADGCAGFRQDLQLCLVGDWGEI